MQDGSGDSSPISFLRQQRVADIVEGILPKLQRRKEGSSWYKTLFIIGIFLVAFIGGYMIGEILRPISYTEKMTLQTLIEHSAHEQKTTPQAVSDDLLRQLNLRKVWGMRAYQWKQAIMILNHYMDLAPRPPGPPCWKARSGYPVSMLTEGPSFSIFPSH